MWQWFLSTFGWRIVNCFWELEKNLFQSLELEFFYSFPSTSISLSLSLSLSLLGEKKIWVEIRTGTNRLHARWTVSTQMRILHFASLIFVLIMLSSLSLIFSLGFWVELRRSRNFVAKPIIEKSLYFVWNINCQIEKWRVLSIEENSFSVHSFLFFQYWRSLFSQLPVAFRTAFFFT